MKQQMSDLNAALRQAQSRYESGLSCAAQFAALARRDPTNLALTEGYAAALVAEGKVAEAEARLATAVANHPGWIEGHRALAALRWTTGAPRADFAGSYAIACAAQPQNRPLWLAWFHSMALIKDWTAARRILADGEAASGAHIGFTLARLYVASESGDEPGADALFAQTQALTDPGLELCRIRYGLRTGRYADAEAAAMRLLNIGAASSAWPYLSLIWRLRGDDRAAWLDAPGDTVKSYDLDFSAAELGDLATFLQGLHTARAPYIDQSVRGGTQTRQPLFFRQEPLIARMKARIVPAIAQYVASLPPLERAHPLSAAPCDAPVFVGSWSVRLKPGGFHVAHTHPMGVISSSFYVALPAPAQFGVPPAGWISFGTPPPELGLALEPYLQIEPKAGRLVLFPSTMWHATEPFDDGERLVIAFDVARAAN